MFQDTPIGVFANTIAAGIILINILQLYNWANKRYIQAILIVYFLFEVIGYATPIEYIPKCQWAAPALWYFCNGSAMFGLGILDYWAFAFNPL